MADTSTSDEIVGVGFRAFSGGLGFWFLVYALLTIGGAAYWASGFAEGVVMAECAASVPAPELSGLSSLQKYELGKYQRAVEECRKEAQEPALLGGIAGFGVGFVAVAVQAGFIGLVLTIRDELVEIRRATTATPTDRS